MGGALPTLNQMSLNLGGQMSQAQSILSQNQTGPTVAQEQQSVIDSILPILNNGMGNNINRNQL